MDTNVEALRRIFRGARLISIATAIGCFLLCVLAVVIGGHVGDVVWLVMAGAVVLSFVSGYTLADAQTFGHLARHDGHMQVHR